MQDAALESDTTSRFWQLFPSLMVPMALAVIDQTIVASALPTIATDLGSVERISWIVIAYLVATTVAAPIYGQLRDVLGGRRMMQVALAIFVAASLLCSAATSIGLLTAARVMQGLGGGGLMTLSQALIGEAVEPRERARYQGWLAAVAVTASTMGPLIGGVFTEQIGWRSIFLVNVPVGLLALWLVRRLPEQWRSDGTWSIDRLGMLYFAGFIVPVMLGIEFAQRFTAGALLEAAVLVAIGAVSFWLLIRQEVTTSHPLLQLELLRQPAIWRSSALVACHSATLVAMVSWLPIYFRIRFGSSAGDAGLLLLPVMIGIGLGSMVTGQLVAKTGLTLIFPSIGLIPVVFLLQVLSLEAGRIGVHMLLVLLLFLGLFMGTVMSVMQVTVQRAAGRARLGAAAASVQFSRSVGAALGTAVVGSVLFAALSLIDPRIVEVFRSMIEQGPSFAIGTTPERAVVIRTEIDHAFGIAFFVLELFAATALALAWTHPERRL